MDPRDRFDINSNNLFSPNKRVEYTVSRVIRDTQLTRQIKDLYNYTCQVCGLRLEGPAGPYAEAAHIRPLGSPHDGPDVIGNILCLCPNHHVLFDHHAFSVADNYEIIGIEYAKLTVEPSHNISGQYLVYHREYYLHNQRYVKVNLQWVFSISKLS